MTDPFSLPPLSVPKFEIPKITHAAEGTFGILKERATSLKHDIGSEHEMAIMCLGAPVMHLDKFGWNGRLFL